MDATIISHRRFWNQYVVPKFEFLKHISSFFYYVLFLVVLAFGFFGYALITEHFTTPYGGDFSQQGLTFCYNFYDSWWAFFRTGNFPNFVHNVFLGNDNVQANTFYGLFSPFTLPLLLFPRSWIPQIQALMSVARLVVGGLLFRVYLKEMGVKENTARIFSYAYAFTGWMAYFLWFNSFYEVISFFPLILYGVEKVIKKKQIWQLSLGMFLMGISNYFFLLTAGIFGSGYAVFRFFQTIKDRDRNESFKVIGVGLLGFLLGSFSSLVVVLPAVITSFGIERSTSSLYLTELKLALKSQDWSRLFELMFYAWSPSVANSGSNPTNYMYCQYFPLASFFFPTISDRFTNIIHYRYFENSATSIFVYTPCILLLYCSIYRSFKTKKISHFVAIAILTICTFTPFFYFLSGMFSNIYGRWELVISTSIITYVALNYDHKDEIPSLMIFIAGFLTFIIMLVLYFVSKIIYMQYNDILNPGFVTGVVVYQFIVVGVETILLGKFWKHKHLNKFLLVFFTVEIVVMGTLVANFHGLQSYETSVNGGYNNVPTEQSIIDQIKADDDSFYRIQSIRAKEGNPNITLTLGYNGASCFHSFYNNNVDDFQRMSMVLKGDTAWSGTAFSKRVNLDEFLGVKYYISKDSETSYTFVKSDGTKYQKVYEPNIPLGFERIDTDIDSEGKNIDGYRVYKNKYHLDFATSYTNIYYKNNCAGTVKNNFYPTYTADVIRNEEVYFKGAILNNEDILEIKRDNKETGFNYIEEAPVRDAERIYYKTVKIYANKNGNGFNPANPDRDINDDCLVDTSVNTKVNTYQIVFDPTSTYYPLGDEGGCYLIDYPVATSYSNYNAAIWLIGEDNEGKSKVITYDECRFNSRNDGRTIRALYSKEKVKRIIICPLGNLYRKNPTFYYEPFENCIARFNEAIANGVSNVVQSVDKFEFDTNYNETRYVVTQVAYTPGWSIKAIDKNGVTSYPKIYNSQGGFVGFIAEKGEYHYVLTYMTPYTGVGLTLSLIALIGTTGFTALGVYLNKKKKATNVVTNEAKTTN